MPFDFIEMKKYELDYDILFHDLYTVVTHIYDNENLQKMYCERWIEELKFADQYLCNQLENANEFEHLLSALEKEPQIYQQKLIFNSGLKFTEASIFFRITYLINILRESEKTNKEKNIQYISLRYLNSEDCNIRWTHEHYDKNYIPSEEPIIICKYMDKCTNSLVIDGNHRITYALKNKIENIKAYFLSPKTLIYNNAMASKFDELLYILKNEISLLYNEKTLKHYDDEKLTSLSFLSNGKYNFD